MVCGDRPCQNGGRAVSSADTLRRCTDNQKKIVEVVCGGVFPAEPLEYAGLSDEELARALWAVAPVVPVRASHPLFVSYTSGSTGKPKGVVHVHGGYMFGIALSMEVVFKIPASKPSREVLLTIGTTGWITGQSYMIAGPLVSGTRAVLLGGSPVFPKLLRFAEAIASEKATILKTGSALIRQLVSSQAAPGLKKLDLSSLKWGTFCAEPVSLDAQEFACQHLCKNFMNSYWATEHGGIVLTRPLDKPIVPDTRTYALPFIDADLDCPAGADLGDVAIRSPYPYLIHAVFGDLASYGTPEWKGDFARLKETYWSRGYFLQGDNARLHADGGFSFHGRSDEVLNVNGIRVGTEEIETKIWQAAAALSGGVACKGVAVVGAPDHVKGATPVGFVQLAGTGQSVATARDQLLAAATTAIRADIGAHAIPSTIFALQAIPKTHTGKVARKTLQLLLAGDPNPDRSSLANPDAVDECRSAVQQWLATSASTSSRVDLAELFERYGIGGHVVLGKAIMPGTGCISAVLEQLCHAHELVSVQFLKPVEYAAVITVLKRGRQVSAVGGDDHAVLFKAELADMTGSAEAEGTDAFPETPSTGRRAGQWADATDRRDGELHYVRCRSLQLDYSGDFITLEKVEWRGLEFWGIGKASHLPAALDAGMQIVCTFSGADTHIPYRVRRFRLDHTAAGKPEPHWGKLQRIVVSGQVLSVDRTKIVANVRVEIPDAGYTGTFFGAEFAKVGSLLPDTLSSGDVAAANGASVTLKDLQAMSGAQRRAAVGSAVTAAGREVMSAELDAAVSLTENGMSSLDQVALLSRVNEMFGTALSVKDWGDQEATLGVRVEAVTAALMGQSGDAKPFSTVDMESVNAVLAEYFRQRPLVEWIDNPLGGGTGFWFRAVHTFIYGVRVGPFGRTRAAIRNGHFDWVKTFGVTRKDVDLEVISYTKWQQVNIWRTDLNRHFTVREIVKASEDGWNLLLHQSGLAAFEYLYGNMFFSSEVDAKFHKEMLINTWSRQRVTLLAIRGPLIDILVEFVEQNTDGTEGEVCASVKWTLVYVVDANYGPTKNDKLIYNFEIGLTDELKRRCGIPMPNPSPTKLSGWTLLYVMFAIFVAVVAVIWEFYPTGEMTSTEMALGAILLAPVIFSLVFFFNVFAMIKVTLEGTQRFATMLPFSPPQSPSR